MISRMTCYGIPLSNLVLAPVWYCCLGRWVICLGHRSALHAAEQLQVLVAWRTLIWW